MAEPFAGSAMADFQDRNLPATHRRLAKAREDGQVARSRDLSHVLPLALGVVLLVVFAPQATRAAGELLADGLRFDARAIASPQAMLQTLGQQSHRLMFVLAPLGVLIAAVAIAGAVVAYRIIPRLRAPAAEMPVESQIRPEA